MPQPGSGIPRRKFFSRVGSLSIRCYVDEATRSNRDDGYLIQITSFHPGALSFGGLSQQVMQRVFNMTLFKAWLTASEALKYSYSTLSGLSLCQHIVRDVEQRLKKETDFDVHFQRAKSQINQINDEMRWRGLAERNASKSLRKIAAVRVNAPRSSERRRGKVESRIGKISGAPSGPVRIGNPQNEVIANQTIAQIGNERSHSENVMMRDSIQVPSRKQVSTASQEHVRPASYFAGRQQLFKISYCNGTATASAVQRIRKMLPLQKGDFLWLLDQFLQDNFPLGGALNCADPSVFPDAGSIWPNLVIFCSQTRHSQHPYAEYLGTVARRASEGTYATMQAVVSLDAALKILRTSILKQSFMKYTNEPAKRQRRYTTFLIGASSPDNLDAEE